MKVGIIDGVGMNVSCINEKIAVKVIWLALFSLREYIFFKYITDNKIKQYYFHLFSPRSPRINCN
jgi:hypothetical protein